MREFVGYILKPDELSYVLHLVAKDQIEAKRKLDSAEKRFHKIDDLFQRLANAHSEFIDEKADKSEFECDE